VVGVDALRELGQVRGAAELGLELRGLEVLTGSRVEHLDHGHCRGTLIKRGSGGPALAVGSSGSWATT
jgi:hypothetical protein